MNWGLCTNTEFGFMGEPINQNKPRKLNMESSVYAPLKGANIPFQGIKA